MAYSHMAYIHMGRNMYERPIQSWGAHFPPSLLIRRKGDSRPNSRAGKAKDSTELNGRVSGLFWGRAWNGLRRADIYKCPTPTTVVGWASDTESEEEWGSTHFVMASWAASITRQGKEERKEVTCSEVSGHMWACHTPLVFGSKVITQI